MRHICLRVVVVLLVPQLADAADLPAKPSLIEVEKSALSFDPQTCVRGGVGFAWGLGSVSVNVLGREMGFCVFDYFDEVEGGYSVYRFRVPVDGPAIKVWVENGGIATSFKLEDGKLLRSGNIHFELGGKRAEGALDWRQQSVPMTDYVNYIADAKTGRGAVAKRGDRVAIRYTFFADQFCDTPLVGIPANRPLTFVAGAGKIGPAIETAVVGMQPGGERRVRLREEVAGTLRETLGGVQPHSQLIVAIELLKIGE